MSDSPLDVANRWIEAYNAQDYDTIRELCDPKIHMEHHNRGFVIDGPDAVVETMNGFGAIAPDKRFAEPRVQHVAGDTVTTRQAFTFTPSVDIDVFGATAGEVFSVDLACIWTVRDGKIVEYHDYG
jgi:ketosteroid isomerase-like protein